jgi:hypothetical protein
MQLSQQARVLKALLKGKKVKMATLNRICYRYSSRIYELRKKGYKIETIQEARGEFSYKLN